MTLLFVCHSVGDTNSLVETAKEIQNQDQEKEIFFFLIGQAAKSFFAKPDAQKWLALSPQIKVKSLADVFNEGTMLELENTAMSPEQRKTVKEFLEKQNLTKALICTPSKMKAGASYQIAEDFAATLDPLLLNDYLYIENNHSFWEFVADEKASANITYLVPTPVIEDKLKSVNDGLTACVIGSPIIDKALNRKLPTDEEILETRAKLELQPQSSFVFVSGSKEQKDDEELLRALFKVMSEPEFAGVEVRMGLHPGIESDRIDAYVEGLTTWMAEYPAVAGRVKLVVNDDMASRIKDELLANPFILLPKQPVTGDAAAAAASGVASSIPASIFNEAGLIHKPAVYTRGDVAPSISIGGNDVVAFFKKAVKKQRLAACTRKELGIPDEGAVAYMARVLCR